MSEDLSVRTFGLQWSCKGIVWGAVFGVNSDGSSSGRVGGAYLGILSPSPLGLPITFKRPGYPDVLDTPFKFWMCSS